MEQGNERYLRQFDFFFSRCFADYRPRFEEAASFDDYVSVTQATEVLKLVDLAREADRRGSRIKFAEQPVD